MLLNKESFDFHNQIVNLLREARSSVVRQINLTMVQTYFEIGKRIVEEEQCGAERAEYGKKLLIGLSQLLTREFGKGFSVDNLENMRKFYKAYEKFEKISRKYSQQKSETASRIFNYGHNVIFHLSFSHYLKLIRISNLEERKFYEIEAINNNWSLRELQRQYDTGLYNRLTLSRDKKGVKELSEKGQVLERAKDAIKDPYILEFIGLPENRKYSES